MSTKSIIMIAVTTSVVLAVTWLDYQHYTNPDLYETGGSLTTAVNPDNQIR